VNASRRNPYAHYKFQITWDGRRVAGFDKASALQSTAEPVEHREGADAGLSPTSSGKTKFEAITLERGVTHDAEFARWATRVQDSGDPLGSEPSAIDLRTDLTIELYDEAGRLVRAHRILRGWVSEFQAIPDLDANANAVAIEHLKLENEGFERDPEVVEPADPSSGDP
jgi:phage tail-like protein